MEARQLVANASFGPAALKVAFEAFDLAWEAIAANYGNDQRAIEAARLDLANAVLAMTREDSVDPVQVKNAALEWLALGNLSPHGTGRPT